MARRLIRLRGLRPGVDIPIVYSGIRPGEKLHEELLGEGEVREPTAHPHIFRIRNGQPSTFNLQPSSVDELITLADAQRNGEIVAQLWQIEHIEGNWHVAMPIHHPGTGTLWPLAKRVMDVVIAALGLAGLGLILPFIAAAIYLNSPGPIFYVQERVGKGGQRFRAYKFRSMVPDAEKGQAMWAQQNDRRVTQVGRILRKTHLDEVPQCLNILKGEMSAAFCAEEPRGGGARGQGRIHLCTSAPWHLCTPAPQHLRSSAQETGLRRLQRSLP